MYTQFALNTFSLIEYIDIVSSIGNQVVVKYIDLCILAKIIGSCTVYETERERGIYIIMGLLS